MNQAAASHAGGRDVLLIVAVVALILIVRAGWAVVKTILKDVFKDAIFIMVWRFISGAHMHGERRTNAGWWTHASDTKRHAFDRDTFMDRWEHKPRGHRALWRLGVLSAVIGVLYGLVVARAVTIHAAEALVVYGLVCAAFVIEKKIRLRIHNRHVINPIAKSLATVLRVSPHAVRKQLHINPENIKDEGEVGYFELTPDQTPSEDMQSTIARIIDVHLPVDTEMDWQMQQAPKLGVIRAGLKPPAEVTWGEMVDAMTRAKYGDIVIGKDRRKDIFSANFIHLENPHWAFCVQTKRGKSNFLGLVAVQVLRQDKDARVTVIDPKEESLIDFLGAPWSGVGVKPLIKGVTMANNPENVEAMWDAIHRAKVDMDRRRAEYARDRTKKFPIHLVVIDELNAFAHLTDRAWHAKLAANKRLDKEMQEDLPKECPVYDDIVAILHMGRFVGVHLIAVAQDFRASLLGGEARNGFGLRGLGGFIPSQWKMFIGTTPVPEAQAGIGRWIFWQGEQQDWVQITKCDRDAAYAWANHGREMHDERAALGYEPEQPELLAGSDDDTDYTASSLPTTTASIVALPVDNRRIIVGVKEAARYLGYAKWRSFDSDRYRYPVPGEFKQGRNVAWYADDLDDWHRNRKGGSNA